MSGFKPVDKSEMFCNAGTDCFFKVVKMSNGSEVYPALNITLDEDLRKVFGLLRLNAGDDLLSASQVTLSKYGQIKIPVQKIIKLRNFFDGIVKEYDLKDSE